MICPICEKEMYQLVGHDNSGLPSFDYICWDNLLLYYVKDHIYKFNGTDYSEAEFDRLLNLKAFL